MSVPERTPPRRRLVDPGRFGRDPRARWRHWKYPEEDAAVAIAWLQHQAACSTVAALKAEGKRLREISDALAGRTGRPRKQIQRRLYGHVVADLADLVGWAIATGRDVVIPADETHPLYPPERLLDG